MFHEVERLLREILKEQKEQTTLLTQMAANLALIVEDKTPVSADIVLGAPTKQP